MLVFQDTKDDSSAYICPLCDKNCQTQHQLTMHIRQVSTVTLLRLLPLHCDHCYDRDHQLLLGTFKILIPTASLSTEMVEVTFYLSFTGRVQHFGRVANFHHSYSRSSRFVT